MDFFNCLWKTFGGKTISNFQRNLKHGTILLCCIFVKNSYQLNFKWGKFGGRSLYFDFKSKWNVVENTRKHSSATGLLIVSHNIPCILGGLSSPPPYAEPLDTNPHMQIPFIQTPRMQTPSHVTCDVCWEANPPLDRMTDTCKNITLPQISFAGGNNDCLPVYYSLVLINKEIIVIFWIAKGTKSPMDTIFIVGLIGLCVWSYSRNDWGPWIGYRAHFLRIIYLSVSSHHSFPARCHNSSCNSYYNFE